MPSSAWKKTNPQNPRHRRTSHARSSITTARRCCAPLRLLCCLHCAPAVIFSVSFLCFFFFFNDTATTEIYTLSLHDALPIFLMVEDVSCLVVPDGCLGLP